MSRVLDAALVALPPTAPTARGILVLPRMVEADARQQRWHVEGVRLWACSRGVRLDLETAGPVFEAWMALYPTDGDRCGQLIGTTGSPDRRGYDVYFSPSAVVGRGAALILGWAARSGKAIYHGAAPAGGNGVILEGNREEVAGWYREMIRAGSVVLRVPGGDPVLDLRQFAELVPF